MTADLALAKAILAAVKGDDDAFGEAAEAMVKAIIKQAISEMDEHLLCHAFVSDGQIGFR